MALATPSRLRVSSVRLTFGPLPVPVRRHRMGHLVLTGLVILLMICIVAASLAAERAARQQELPVHGRRPAVDLQTARGLNQLSNSNNLTDAVASLPPSGSISTSSPSSLHSPTVVMTTNDALPVLAPSPRAHGPALPSTASSAHNATKPPAARDPFHDAVWKRNRVSTSSPPLLGPLCVFVPSDGHDEKHLKEVEAVLEAWGDASTLLFTENPIVMERTEEVATRKGIARALVEMEEWKSWQRDLILAYEYLRRRGATNESLRGRGQLSIPLFYWISQLVKNKDPLVQNCKWFMKCDTDTYLRRKLFEAKQLSTLDPQRPFHVGVPLNFNTRPYHTTFRYINFQYNIGGPGYTFSRGLMEKVRIEECIESMTRDPVLLIHDDVATGYCASYHVDGAHRINANATVTSSLSSLVEYVADRDTLFETLGCLDCVAALHPVTANLMITLGKRDQLKTLDRRLCIMTEQCTLKFMLGTIPVVGELWRLDGLMQSIQRYWQLNDVRVLDHVNRKIAQVALDQIAAWKSA